jgi:hypothetical protein
MRGQTISGLITINLVSDNIYHGLAFKIILYNVIHPYVFVFMFVELWMVGVRRECPIPTKTPKRALNHIMVR